VDSIGRQTLDVIARFLETGVQSRPVVEIAMQILTCGNFEALARLRHRFVKPQPDSERVYIAVANSS